MADAQIGGSIGVTARGGTNINGGAGVDAGFVLTNAAADTIAAMKTRLNAISATSYTAERLATMSYNDMVYAIRLADHAGSM